MSYYTIYTYFPKQAPCSVFWFTSGPGRSRPAGFETGFFGSKEKVGLLGTGVGGSLYSNNRSLGREDVELLYSDNQSLGTGAGGTLYSDNRSVGREDVELLYSDNRSLGTGAGRLLYSDNRSFILVLHFLAASILKK